MAERSNRAVTYAVVAALGVGGAGGTWWGGAHRHDEIAELRSTLVDVMVLVQRREAIAEYWVKRFLELERRLNKPSAKRSA